MKKFVSVFLSLFITILSISVFAEPTDGSLGTKQTTYGTWRLNESISDTESFSSNCCFVSDEKLFFSFQKDNTFVFFESDAEDIEAYNKNGWSNDNYRKITLLNKPSSEFENWLNTNGTKEEDEEIFFSTWIINSDIDDITSFNEKICFFTSYYTFTEFSKNDQSIYYSSEAHMLEACLSNTWKKDDYRTVTFTKIPDGEFLTWLTTYAEKTDDINNISMSTWILNEKLDGSLNVDTNCSFMSNDYLFTRLNTKDGNLIYQNGSLSFRVLNEQKWKKDEYRTITFFYKPEGDLLSWLNANGKVADSAPTYLEGSAITEPNGFPCGVIVGIAISAIVFAIFLIIKKKKKA